MNKPNITPLPGNDVDALSAHASALNPNVKPSVGLIAQEVGTILPTAVIGAQGSNSYYQPSVTSSLSRPSSLELNGEDADIRINGESLCQTLRGIQERLLILTPNKQLEAEWEELQELGEKYRALEKELTSASKMWKILSQD